MADRHSSEHAPPVNDGEGSDADVPLPRTEWELRLEHLKSTSLWTEADERAVLDEARKMATLGVALDDHLCDYIGALAQRRALQDLWDHFDLFAKGRVNPDSDATAERAGIAGILAVGDSAQWSARLPISESERSELPWDERVRLSRARAPFVKKALALLVEGARLARKVAETSPSSTEWTQLTEHVNEAHRSVTMVGRHGNQARMCVVGIVDGWSASPEIPRLRLYRVFARRRLGLPLTRREKEVVTEAAGEDEEVQAAQFWASRDEHSGRLAEVDPVAQVARAAYHELLDRLPRRSRDGEGVPKVTLPDMEATLRAFCFRSRGQSKWAVLNERLLLPLGLAVEAPEATLPPEWSKWRSQF